MEYSFWKHFFTKWRKFATKKSLYWTLAPKPNFLNNEFIVSQFWHGLKVLYHPLHIKAGCYMVFSTLACFMDFCLVTRITISFARTIHLNIVITTCYGFPSSSDIGICKLNTPRLVNPSFFFSYLVGEGLCEIIVSNNWIMIFFRCSYYQFACLSNTLDTNFPNFIRNTHLLCIRVTLAIPHILKAAQNSVKVSFGHKIHIIIFILIVPCALSQLQSQTSYKH